MEIELTAIELRRLADLVYIGNWILNSTRTDDILEDYELLQEKIFLQCRKCGMLSLAESYKGHIIPSRAYEEGGIHEAIEAYEQEVFFDILAEALARRDMEEAGENEDNIEVLERYIDDYLSEFEKNHLDNLRIVP